MHIKIPHRGNIQEDITTDYKISEDGRFLETWIKTSQPGKFEIFLLTAGEMELWRSGSARIEKYVRIKD
jgi:hypothetical protein